MARFESGWQIFGFLLGAALVSLAVIAVLRVEAEKRYGEDDGDGGDESASFQQTIQSGERSVRWVSREIVEMFKCFISFLQRGLLNSTH
jgi:hypothetical protein